MVVGAAIVLVRSTEAGASYGTHGTVATPVLLSTVVLVLQHFSSIILTIITAHSKHAESASKLLKYFEV